MAQQGAVALPPYVKRFVNTPPSEVVREAALQRAAAALGLAPRVLSTDGATFIEMDNLGAKNTVPNIYGEDFCKVPEDAREAIYDILRELWLRERIEYVDVTGYNFVQTDERMRIIDFGHAAVRDELSNYFMRETFDEGGLVSWNADFA